MGRRRRGQNRRNDARSDDAPEEAARSDPGLPLEASPTDDPAAEARGELEATPESEASDDVLALEPDSSTEGQDADSEPAAVALETEPTEAPADTELEAAPLEVGMAETPAMNDPATRSGEAETETAPVLGSVPEPEPSGAVPALEATAPDTDAPADDRADSGDEDGAIDEFAATRERVADPDDWRVEKRRPGFDLTAGGRRRTLTPEELTVAKKFRAIVHAATATSIALTLLALTLHVLDIGPVGLETWLMILAVGAFLGAAYAFPKARFEPVQPTGTPEELSRARQVREVTLRSFGVGFGILFAIIGFLEIMALFVGLGWIADLSQSQVTLAKHFVFIPALALGTLIAGTYVRMRMPAIAKPVPHQEKIEAGGAALFVLASIVAFVFSLGIPFIVQATEVEARQGIYIATVTLLTALAIGNIRLGFPDVVRIIREEVEQAKLVDRRSAETMHKKMLRNYVLALVFVVGSIGFLVSKAAGFIDTEKSGSLDVVLLVYLGLGILFLGTVLMHFFQAKQISSRVILPKKGQTLGKKRYSQEQVTKFTMLGVSGFFALMFLIGALLIGTGRLDAVGPFEVTKAHATDFGVFAILSAIGPFGFHYARETARIRAIDEKFPDFLRDLAESQRAGMTLPKALITASKGVYGPLTKEIQIMAAQVEWGVSFSDALRRFAERTRTPLIERTVSLVIEASASGGNVVDILAAASDDAREIKNILTERKQQMGVYSLIIYIAFGVFLTVITVLNSQFIPELAGATSQVAGTSLGGIQFGDIDVPTYQRLFWHAALIQALGGGLVSGVMTEGHPFSGLRHSFIMTLASYGIFRFIIM